MLYECLETILDRIDKRVAIEKIICLIISAILGLSVGAFCVSNADTSPAKFDDYIPLNEILLEIEKEPSIVLSTNSKVEINDDEILITVENEQCSLTGTYSKDFKLQSRKQNDKATSILMLIFGFVIVSFLSFTLFYIVTLLAVYVIWFIVAFALSIYKKYSKKAKQEANTHQPIEENTEEDDQDDDL